jgi:biopolymer transport protein ExbB
MVASGTTWVLCVLFGLSFLSVSVSLERLLVFRRTEISLPTLMPELRRLLRLRDYSRAISLLQRDGSVPSAVVATGLHEVHGGAGAAAEAMAAAMGLERTRLERRLVFLGTVGNNAPFVGLLGTVIGIVGAFDALGKPQAVTATLATTTSALAPERVMSTIAEALVATAVGLIVAIPAVAVFNYFQARVATVVADAETLGHVLLAHLQASDHAGPARQVSAAEADESPSAALQQLAAE